MTRRIGDGDLERVVGVLASDLEASLAADRVAAVRAEYERMAQLLRQQRFVSEADSLVALSRASWLCQVLAREEARAQQQIFNENADRDGEDPGDGWDFDYYQERVVEETQQWLHDVFIDTEWPRCPRHVGHPLWLVGGAWRCDKDDVLVAPLGELRSIASG